MRSLAAARAVVLAKLRGMKTVRRSRMTEKERASCLAGWRGMG
jgi:hypothetical protein